MGTTTSNQDLGITTKTSDHVAKTAGATDVCWNPPVKVTVPHANEVSTTKATEHTSSKTMFSGGNVVRLGDAIGPPSGPAHPDNGAGGGVVSHTHLKEARITSASPNVKAEGKALGRKTDPTTQNHGNTTGSITGGNPATTVSEADAEKLLACSLDTIVVTCSHGRKPGNEHLLEVTSPDTITLVATRKNAKTGGAPECSKPPHTKWVIRQTKKGKVSKEETKTGDSITLDNAWFTWGDLDKGAAETSAKGEVSNTTRTSGDAAAEERRLRRTPSGRAEVESTRQATGLGRGAARTGMMDRYRAGQQAGRTINDGIGNAANAAAAGAGLVKATTNIADFYKVWNAVDEQIEVTVEAFACSGGDKYVFRSYPGKEIEFSASEYIEKVRAVVQALARIFQFVQRIAALAGLPTRGEAKLLDPFDLIATVVWEEMTTDSIPLRKYKHHCDRGWGITLQATLAKVEETFAIPLLWFANLFFPGIGTAANKLVEAVGASATVGIEVSVELAAAVWAERKPGAASATCGGGFPVKFGFYARVALSAGRWAQVSGGINVQGEPRFQIVTPSIDLFAAYIKLLPGEVKVGFKGMVKIDVYFWSSASEVEHYPDSAKVTWGEVPLKFMSLLKQ